MKATPEDQAKLLDLQALDKTIAGLKHELATLPAAQKVKEIEATEKQLQTEIALATSKKKDLMRAQKDAEAEVDKVQQRAKSQRQRLDSGEASPREMERIQEELAQLATRQGDLEDKALEAMDAMDDATERLQTLENKQDSMVQQKATAQEQATHEAQEITDKQQSAQSERKALADSLPPGLLAEYEECRRSSGIGAVEVQGTRSIGVQLAFSMVEISRIETAPADEVIISEDHDVILVRR